MKIAYRFLLSGSLIAGAFACGCTSGGSPAPGATAQASTESTEVEVVKVTTQKLDVAQGLPGELVPYESVAIYPKTTGFVKSVAVDRGSRVKQGELLAQLEAPELAAQLNEAESKLATAQSQLAAAQAKLASDQGTYERLTAAAKTPGVVAGNELDIAAKVVEAGQANVAAAGSGIKAAEAARVSVAQVEDYLRITAPFDGVVIERNVHPGALVGSTSGAGTGVPMLRIETLTRLRLVVPVPESSVAAVPAGTSVKFTVSAYPTETFQAPVARVSHAIDPKTRTMPVELEVANAAGRLTPGTFCQVQWPIRRSSATHFVPPTAVATNQARTFVIRVADRGADAGKAEWVDVKTGASAGNLVEVFGDLKDGDQVVLRASDAIRPGYAMSPRLVTESR
jgi:membrane fusion protein (multidrug efflux system)